MVKRKFEPLVGEKRVSLRELLADDCKELKIDLPIIRRENAGAFGVRVDGNKKIKTGKSIGARKRTVKRVAKVVSAGGRKTKRGRIR